MVQNDPAKKKLRGSKADEIVFLLGILSVYIHFTRIKGQEGVGGTGLVVIESLL